MKTETEVRQELSKVRMTLNIKIQEYREEINEDKKREIHNSVMHLDGQVLAYKWALGLYT